MKDLSADLVFGPFRFKRLLVAINHMLRVLQFLSLRFFQQK